MNNECYVDVASPKLFSDGISLAGIGKEILKPIGYISYEICVDDFHISTNFMFYNFSNMI